MTGIKTEDWAGRVGPGWSGIVEGLKEVVRVLDYNYKFDLWVSDVKEKYGGLRFYYSVSGEDCDKVDWIMEGAVHMAEAMSYLTCETCGRPGETNEDGYWKVTLCGGCRGKYNRDMDKVLMRGRPWWWRLFGKGK